MNCGLSDLFCCVQPLPSVTFAISRVELAGAYPYADVFLQVDRTFILDSDCLSVSKPGELRTNNKEPGNLSGVSRVTFPDKGETFIISYIRCVNGKMIAIGEAFINIPMEQRDSISTDDTGYYSPMFRPSLNKKYMLT